MTQLRSGNRRKNETGEEFAVSCLVADFKIGDSAAEPKLRDKKILKAQVFRFQALDSCSFRVNLVSTLWMCATIIGFVFVSSLGGGKSAGGFGLKSAIKPAKACQKVSAPSVSFSRD